MAPQGETARLGEGGLALRVCECRVQPDSIAETAAEAGMNAPTNDSDLGTMRTMRLEVRCLDATNHSRGAESLHNQPFFSGLLGSLCGPHVSCSVNHHGNARPQSDLTHDEHVQPCPSSAEADAAGKLDAVLSRYGVGWRVSRARQR